MGTLINTPISTKELERRWGAIRAAMAAADIDALLVSGSNDLMHGYIKYLTDMPALAYPTTLIFPRDDEMTLIMHGELDGDFAPDKGEIGFRGVGRVLTCSTFPTVHFSLAYESTRVVVGLRPYLAGRIGLVGAQSMPTSVIDAVRTALRRGGMVVSASDLVDRIKAVRSAEEVAAARRTAALQDEGVNAIIARIAPGMREREVMAEAELVNRRGGSEQGAYLCSSGPLGTAAPLRPPHLQERELQEGDAFHFLIETSGPGGLYAEIGRTVVLGTPSVDMQEEFEFVKQARQFTLDRLRPGADAAGIWSEFNAFMRDNKRPEETRIHCHGQGYDLLERPLVRFDETMKIEPDMILACHPTYVHRSSYNWICDSYLTTQAAPERLHRTPEIILVAS